MGTVTQRDLAHIQAQLGGSNPISMSEYYRGGAYVPTTRSTIVREPTSGEYYSRTAPSSNFNHAIASNLWGLNFNGTAITPVATSGPPPASYTDGGFTYYRGTYRERSVEDYVGSVDLWAVYRTSGGTTTINTGVPSSGAISLNSLLGAANP
jgi:hypothetical protein